jgi:glyoxylase-like metal-dependent hydrolase (beta-lactamase superfamily II)
MSRILMATGVITAALIASVHAQQGQAPPPAAAGARPAVEVTKVEGTSNVYIFRNQNHQAMFIVTDDGVIATDPVAYGRPTGGQTYVNEIRKITDKPIRYLIYSHHHFDHIAGGKAFKDAGARIIAHKRAAERLAQLNDPHTPLPDETVDERRTITLGGTTLELTFMGLHHSDSALIMRLPREKIIFVVDTVPVGSFPGRGFIDIYPLETEDFIEKLLAMDWDRMIPGHPGAPNGRLGTKDDARSILALMRDASAEIKKPAQEGKCWAAEKDLKLEKYASWPGYNQENLELVGRRYCGVWGRGT